MIPLHGIECTNCGLPGAGFDPPPGTGMTYHKTWVFNVEPCLTTRLFKQGKMKREGWRF